MKIFTMCAAGLLLSSSLCSQSEEFEVYPNGLIYSEKTMYKLGQIVDSLNLAFMSCDLNKVYYANPQTVGHLIELDTLNVREAKKDMEQQMSLDAFLKKYPAASIDRDVIIVKHRYHDTDNKEHVMIEQLVLKGHNGFLRIESDDLALYHKDLKNQWLFKYREKTKYSKESISAFYFPNAFESRQIPEKYAKMIAYSDCLVDTTTTKLKENAQYGRVQLPADWMTYSDQKKEALLEEMRSTRVMGSCSQDSAQGFMPCISPRFRLRR